MTNNVFGKGLQDLFKVLSTAEGQEIFVSELQSELNREIVEKIMNSHGAAFIEQAKRNEAAIVSATSNQALKQVINQEMEIGDYAVLYQVNPGNGIFVPITYKITGINVATGKHSHITSVVLRPLRVVGIGSFHDHEVTMDLDKIAFYHNREIRCYELLEDHARWLSASRAAHRELRAVELNLLAKCKLPKNNF